METGRGNMKRYIIEGKWSGYTSAQQRVVHRTVTVSTKLADKIKTLESIQFTDGTSLYITVREAKYREKVEIKDSYTNLINKCISQNKTKVIDLD
jgi:hypothetical protein